MENVIPDLPMYRVQEGSDTKSQVLHRNLLFSLGVDQESEIEEVPVENSNVVSKLDVEDDTQAETDYGSAVKSCIKAPPLEVNLEL